MKYKFILCLALSLCWQLASAQDSADADKEVQELVIADPEAEVEELDLGDAAVEAEKVEEPVVEAAKEMHEAVEAPALEAVEEEIVEAAAADEP